MSSAKWRPFCFGLNVLNECHRISLMISQQAPSHYLNQCWPISLTSYVSLTNNELNLTVFSQDPAAWLINLKVTRRSENDNTPQPLDQWTNSPFIGQQAGNCKSFILTHYLADLFAMHRGHAPKVNPIVHPTSYPFHSTWVDPPIPKLQQFQYLTLKIQGQGHGWGQSLKSQCESNILSTHIPFVPCQSAIPFLRFDFFKIWPWKSKVKVMEEVNIESHNIGPKFCQLKSLLFHVNLPSHSWDTAFSKFDLENPRSRSWVKWPFKVTKWV